MKGRTPEGLRDGQVENSGRFSDLLQRVNLLRGIDLKNVKNIGLRALGIAAIATAPYLPLFEGRSAADAAFSPRTPITTWTDGLPWSQGVAWADTGRVDGVGGLPWVNGKYQTFPRLVDAMGNIAVLQQIDLGTLGPDADTIFGLDFEGDIPTGALVVHRPAGEVLETRVVGIKRVDLETVQFRGAIGGDRFDVYQISKFGGDDALDRMARLHAQNTARAHQKVVYIGDLGLFQRQWGANEQEFLHAIIRAQRPSQAGIPEPNFVFPRGF